MQALTLAPSLDLVSNGYTVFAFVTWGLVAGFLGAVVAAATAKSGGVRKKATGLTLPNRQEVERIIVGGGLGVILGLGWGASELRSIDGMVCEQRGLRLNSKLDSHLIVPSDQLTVSVARVDLRGNSPFRMEFVVGQQVTRKTVRLTSKDADRARDYASQCLASR